MKLQSLVSMLLCCAALVVLTATTGRAQAVKKETFGKMPDGRIVDLYTLTNANGMEARIINYGAVLVSLKVPDQAGELGDVVLGFDDLDGYLKNTSFLGATVGRYANRIARGRFTLNGVAYRLAINNGENHLHGGLKGFDKAIWHARALRTSDGPALELTYLSKDGEEGYPGNLSVRVVYTITSRNEMKIEYSATSDKDTIINLTHHSYFNLAGQGNGDILNHKLMINARSFTPTDAGSIPTGKIQSVAGTPFDFRQPAVIGARISDDNEQLQLARGYDQNWVLNGRAGVLKLAARVSDPSSGRVMEVLTTEPGLQFYTGNYLDGSLTGKDDKVYKYRYGLCLEAEHFPDSPNKPNFPSVVLRKGARFRSTTIYRFSTMK
jgi:aldose 1-epimerase